MGSFSVRNFGCRANQAEAFAWAEAFRDRGLRLEEDWGRSDVVVVNSCTLTGRADRDVKKFIRTVHRGDPRTRIVVTGCYAERAPAEIADLPGVVSVLPQSAKPALADYRGGTRRPTRLRPLRRGADPRGGSPAGPRLSEDPGRLRQPLCLLRHPQRQGPEPQRRSGGRRGVRQGPGRPRFPGDRPGRHPPLLLRGRPRAADLARDLLDRARAGRGGRPAEAELPRSAQDGRRTAGPSRPGRPDLSPLPSFAATRLGPRPPGDGPPGRRGRLRGPSG